MTAAVRQQTASLLFSCNNHYRYSRSFSYTTIKDVLPVPVLSSSLTVPGTPPVFHSLWLHDKHPSFSKKLWFHSISYSSSGKSLMLRGSNLIKRFLKYSRLSAWELILWSSLDNTYLLIILIEKVATRWWDLYLPWAEVLHLRLSILGRTPSNLVSKTVLLNLWRF